jgi:hypothetical protein
MSANEPVCLHLTFVITKALQKRRGPQISPALRFDASTPHIAVRDGTFLELVESPFQTN